LLENAMRAVRPGGLIAYATCSPHLAETEFVVEDAMKGREDFELLNANQVALEIPNLQHAEEFARLAESGPYLRLWPHLHDTDGMFLALLRRKS
jgi:16S rRNA (cytosine967-C5)-methyltransferase